MSWHYSELLRVRLKIQEADSSNTQSEMPEILSKLHPTSIQLRFYSGKVPPRTTQDIGLLQKGSKRLATDQVW